jgi:hypothetical protein
MSNLAETYKEFGNFIEAKKLQLTVLERPRHWVRSITIPSWLRRPSCNYDKILHIITVKCPAVLVWLR